MVARLDALERRLDERDKADQKQERLAERGHDDLRQAIEKLHRQSDDVARRLKALEQDRRGGDVAGDLRQLRQDVDRASRALDDLRARVARLEARK